MNLLMPISNCLVGDVIAEDICDIQGNLLCKKKTAIEEQVLENLLKAGVLELRIENPFHKNHHETNIGIIQAVRKSLSYTIFKKDINYTRITECLAHMYVCINSNPIIINILDRLQKTDAYTFQHSINTAFYSMLIAIWMNLDDQQIMHATQAGILHDVGKIFIPSEILNKPDRLTHQEYALMKNHTLFGYFLINDFDVFHDDVKKAVLLHHERNGVSGYPLCVSSDRIGLIPKIVAVADVYDAMTTQRVYKKAQPPMYVLEYLNHHGDSEFDRHVLSVFLDNIPIYDFKEHQNSDMVFSV